MSACIDRAASAIIAGTSRRRIALSIMEAYRTWPGCTECLPGCTVKTSGSMCPRYAVHVESVIAERMVSKNTDCMDCGTEHHSCPPLHEHIWRSIADHGLLCWPCAEKRLGRALTLDDLMPCGWNSFAIFQHTGRMVTVADKISDRLPDFSSPRPAQPWRNPATMREPRWRPMPAMHFRVRRWSKWQRRFALLPIAFHLSNRARDRWIRERFRATKRGKE